MAGTVASFANARRTTTKEPRMSRRLPALACTAALACAGAFASLPVHADRVAWNVTIGGPGFAVSAGQPWGGRGAGPVVRPVVAPWAPVVAPVPVFMPGPAVVPFVRPVRWRHGRPVVVAAHVFVPAPAFRRAPMVVVRPF
jgi:hypothetical protein